MAYPLLRLYNKQRSDQIVRSLRHQRSQLNSDWNNRISLGSFVPWRWMIWKACLKLSSDSFSTRLDQNFLPRGIWRYVETDPRIFSSVRYVYKRSNVPRTVTSKDSVTPQIWYVCLGEKENTVHHYSLIRSPQSLSGGHVKTKIRGISRIFRDI